MRLGVPENLTRGAGVYKGLQDEAMQRVFSSRGELTVGERSGTTKAKLDIAVLIELARTVEVFDVARSTCGIGAALDEERLEACVRQGKGGEEACAARAYDDGSRRGAMADCVGLREVRLVVVGEMDVLASGFVECLNACEFLGAVVELNACAQDEVLFLRASIDFRCSSIWTISWGWMLRRRIASRLQALRHDSSVDPCLRLTLMLVISIMVAFRVIESLGLRVLLPCLRECQIAKPRRG